MRTSTHKLTKETCYQTNDHRTTLPGFDRSTWNGHDGGNVTAVGGLSLPLLLLVRVRVRMRVKTKLLPRCRADSCGCARLIAAGAHDLKPILETL
jgi:hypothetical protein